MERESLLELIILGAVAGEHLLVIGPPGTAKSEAVRRISRRLDAEYFEYLLGRFTEPGEIFGPVDLVKLKEGSVETRTQGMLPEAQFAFLDEVFLGSTPILNTLLGILNERVYRRGHTFMNCPLRICVGASNRLPEDDSLAAFSDRFLLRVFLNAVPDPLIEELLENGWSLQSANPGEREASTEGMAKVEDLDFLAAVARGMDLAPLRDVIGGAIRLLRSAGIFPSDRRIVKSQRLMAAAAALDGRTEILQKDLWPLIFALPGPEEQETGREVLADLLSESENRSLPAAAEEASHGPRARAARLLELGRVLLENFRNREEEPIFPEARLKLEGFLRELDAGLSPEQMPEELTRLRSEAAGIIGDADEKD